MPAVLYLVCEAKLPPDVLAGALAMIESFIVRRDICGLPTGNYNRLFVAAVERMRKSDGDPVAALAAHLAAGRIDTARWPDDQAWRTAWLGRDQYKSARQGRLRYLFEAVEKKKRSALSEEIEIKSALSLEHIMPQKWRVNWPVPGFDHVPEGELNVDQMARELDREKAINKLGNLTLLTQALNSANSNAPFAVKMPKIKAHASLALNR